jgi:hypothetical protein
MSVANSLLSPTYPARPTQAGYTISTNYATEITQSGVEVCRQQLPKGIWLMTASLVLSGTFNTIEFGIKVDGFPYLTEYFFVTHTANPYSYTMTTPIELLETKDVVMDASVSTTTMAIGDGTLVQFTRLS